MKKEEDFSRCYHDKKTALIEGTSETKVWWQGIEKMQGIQGRTGETVGLKL